MNYRDFIESLRLRFYNARKKIVKSLNFRPRFLTVPDMLRAERKSRSKTAPNLYGILMMRGDLDVLEEVMDCNHAYFRGIFVLDGTGDWQSSKKILDKYPNIELYLRDDDLGSEYDRPPRDGARQALLDALQKKYGYDGYIVTLHSDEMFYDFPPTLLASAMQYFKLDALSVRNVPFFLHSTQKDTYTYMPGKSIIEQVHYASFPGFSEFRIFKNGPGLHYRINEHSRVIPQGVRHIARTSFPLRHYLYRFPEQMKGNAADRGGRGWQRYGFEWMRREPDVFVDCLPKYEFAKYIPEDMHILNGEDGAFQSA